MVAAMSAPKRRATYEDLMEVPDTKVAEIIDGELIVSPRPAMPHTHAASARPVNVTRYGQSWIAEPVTLAAL
jgi:hypothetical protein